MKRASKTGLDVVCRWMVWLSVIGLFPPASQAEEPIDVVRQLIVVSSKKDDPESRTLYNTLRLKPTEIATPNAVLAPDEFQSPSWCITSKTDGDAAVVSVVTLKDSGFIDPDPCYLVRVTNAWRVLSPRTNIKAARGIVAESSMQALERLSTWYSSHKKSLVDDLAKEFAAIWKGTKAPQPAELRKLQIQVLSKRDPKGYTPNNPFLAETIADSARIKVLLEDGLDANLRNTSRFNQDTLLYFAVRHGATETVILLLDSGAQVNAKSAALGKTALFQAAFDGRIDVVRILVKGGADVNALDADSNNALREAILGKRYEVVKFLLEQGAKPNQRNSDGQTMADIARTAGTPQIKALFK